MAADVSHMLANSRFVVSVDAMGGDKGPATVVAGLVISAARHFLHRKSPRNVCCWGDVSNYIDCINFIDFT